MGLDGTESRGDAQRELFSEVVSIGVLIVVERR